MLQKLSYQSSIDELFNMNGAAASSIKYSGVVELFGRLFPFLNEAFKRELEKKSFNIQLKKGDILVNTGEVCTNLYVIKKGLIRGFIDYGRKDITMWMSYEKEFVTSVSSFLTGIPANENIQALEDCDLECISGDTLQYFYKHFQESHILKSVVLKNYCQDAEERVFIGRLTNAKERYLHLFQGRHRQMLTRAPLKHVASFLGIRLETLSRLRSSGLHRHISKTG
jgi:CRP-like cAMP-binding protein